MILVRCMIWLFCIEMDEELVNRTQKLPNSLSRLSLVLVAVVVVAAGFPPCSSSLLPQLLPLRLSFVVLRATHHNPLVIHFHNAWAAARRNIATRSANERIGEQEATNKNANG